MTENPHISFIRQSYELAQSAVDNGNHPFGALLVYRGEVVLTAENTVNSDRDVTRHAELNLVQRAERELSEEVRSECILYTSTEPCAMCSGSIYWAGYKIVVFGTAEKTLGQIADGGLSMPCRDIFGAGTRTVTVIGPILDEEGSKLHTSYWTNL